MYRYYHPHIPTHLANYTNCEQISVHKYDKLSPISLSGIKREKMANKVPNQEHVENFIK